MRLEAILTLLFVRVAAAVYNYSDVDSSNTKTSRYLTRRTSRYTAKSSNRTYKLSELIKPTDHLLRFARDIDNSYQRPSFKATEEPMMTMDKKEPDVTIEMGEQSDEVAHLSKKQVQFLQSQIDKYFMVGYDCSHPKDVSAVSSFIDDPCTQQFSEKDTVDVEKTTMFQILQYEDRRTIEAVRCTRWQSQSVYYCGNHDHATPLPSMSYHRRLSPLKREECKKLKTLGKYKAGNGKEYSIPKDQHVTVSYYTHGNAAPYTSWMGSQITCVGDRLRVGTEDVDSMVVYRTEQVFFRDETIIEREDKSLVAFYDNIRLTCALTDGWCESSLSTYVWDTPASGHCPLYSVKHFQGQILTSTANPGRVLTSTDKSLVRFVLKDKFPVCGQIAYCTNYKDLVIVETRHTDGTPKQNLITRKLLENY